MQFYCFSSTLLKQIIWSRNVGFRIVQNFTVLKYPPTTKNSIKIFYVFQIWLLFFSYKWIFLFSLFYFPLSSYLPSLPPCFVSLSFNITLHKHFVLPSTFLSLSPLPLPLSHFLPLFIIVSFCIRTRYSSSSSTLYLSANLPVYFVSFFPFYVFFSSVSMIPYISPTIFLTLTHSSLLRTSFTKQPPSLPPARLAFLSLSSSHSCQRSRRSVENYL